MAGREERQPEPQVASVGSVAEWVVEGLAVAAKEAAGGEEVMMAAGTEGVAARRGRQWVPQEVSMGMVL